MMDVLIISDSHGKEKYLREILSRQPKRPSAILFLGDGLRGMSAADTGGIPLYAVRGNCDWSETDFPEELSIILEEKRLILSHGHLYSVKSSYMRVLKHGIEEEADAVLFGHTHHAELYTLPKGSEYEGKILTKDLMLFNPGALCEGSFGMLHIEGGKMLFSHGDI